jgi:hypothetical protein
MVQIIPMNDNPTKDDIYAYIRDMLNTDEYNVLEYVNREIRGKCSAGALLHPSEEYFVNTFFSLKGFSSNAKNM